MKEFETRITDTLYKGLRKHHGNLLNTGESVKCLNVKPSKRGLVPITALTYPITDDAGVLSWPYPQLFDTREDVASNRWIHHLDDNDWQSYGSPTTLWVNDTYWDVYFSSGHMRCLGGLVRLGTWTVGFRPTTIKVTYECTGGVTVCWLWMYGSKSNLMFNNVGYTSGAGQALDFSGGDDIARLYFRFEVAAEEYTAHITDIEFYEEE